MEGTICGANMIQVSKLFRLPMIGELYVERAKHNPPDLDFYHEGRNLTLRMGRWMVVVTWRLRQSRRRVVDGERRNRHNEAQEAR